MTVIPALRLELHSLLEHYLLPLTAALMPWPLGYRWLRFAARHPWLFADEWPRAWRALCDSGLINEPDADGWAWRYRTCRLVDNTDAWLSRLRSDRWLARHVDRVGAWPTADRPGVALFVHWCAGLWGLRSLRAAGKRGAFVSSEIVRLTLGGARLGLWYGHVRKAEVARALGAPVLYPPDRAGKSARTLADGTWIIIAPDVPVAGDQTCVEVIAFGRTARLQDGWLEVARKAGVEVVCFDTALDFATGRRELRISAPIDPNAPDAAQRVASNWEARLREASWGYSLWHEMPAFVPGTPMQR